MKTHKDIRPKGSSAPESPWPAFWRDLLVTFFGTLAAFALAVWWDLSERRATARDDVQAASNVFYSQVQTNYHRMRRAGPVLRAEMQLLEQKNTDRLLDVSDLVELQETQDELLVRLAPTVGGDVELMNRILTQARESKVINSQMRWRGALRARRLENLRECLALFRTDSLLLSGMRTLMGQIEEPDTLYKRMRIPPLK